VNINLTYYYGLPMFLDVAFFSGIGHLEKATLLFRNLPTKNCTGNQISERKLKSGLYTGKMSLY